MIHSLQSIILKKWQWVKEKCGDTLDAWRLSHITTRSDNFFSNYSLIIRSRVSKNIWDSGEAATLDAAKHRRLLLYNLLKCLLQKSFSRTKKIA